MSLSDSVFLPGFDLGGTHLVAASAGTGKTYSIQTLYLRLILVQELTVQQILVVTFTKAATQELRERLRRVLSEALDVLEERMSRDHAEARVVSLLDLAAANGAGNIASRLRLALLDFDLATIYTIHGFCKRILDRFAFETGQPFDVDPLEQSQDEIARLCHDWWRRQAYRLNAAQLRLFQEEKITPSLLTEMAARRIDKPDARLVPPAWSPEAAAQQIEKELRQARARDPAPSCSTAGMNLTAKGQADLDAFRQAMQSCLAAMDAGEWDAAYARLCGAEKMKCQQGRRKVPALETHAPEWMQALKTAQSFRQGLVAWAVESIAAAYRDSRAAATSATFNDYLVDLRRALRDDQSNGPLHTALRRTFRAALIDEFQDTDPIQWGIFSDLFGHQREIPCFLVGDPKQAIYRFRNGDIETYVKATEAIPPEARHELDVNYRAEQRLVDAVNQIFRDRDRSGSVNTFQSASIAYPGDLKAAGKSAAASLTIDGRPDQRPFKIWLINNDKPGRIPGRSSPIAHGVFAATADGIGDILNDPRTLIAGRRVQPAQIAVIVHTHFEAGSIAAELRQRGIPCVRQATGNIWQMDEAQPFWALLRSVLNPSDTTALRGALLTRWIGLDTPALARLNAGEALSCRLAGVDQPMALEDWVMFFETLGALWRTRGFAALFNRLADDLDLRARLAAGPEGLRQLTNLFHLAECIQTAIIEGRQSPERVLAWMSERMQAGAEGGEAERLRMESDADAVKIMTVFASKGLEFPIVFAPTLFMLKPKANRAVYEYHGEAGGLVITRNKDEGQQRENDEIDIEHLRHIYVVLTRAVHRTVLVAVRSDDAAPQQPLQWLLGAGARADGGADGTFSPAQPAHCAIDVRACPEPPVTPTRYVPTPPVVYDCPETPVIDVSHGHGSFTSLAPQRSVGPSVPFADEARNRDAETAPDNEGAAVDVDEPDGADEAATVGIFAFPAGAKTGTCWHEIFEEIPFDADEAAVASAVEEKLQLYGFLKEAGTRETRLRATRRMVRAVLDQTLPDTNDAVGGFALRCVQPADRQAEWAFAFSTAAGQRTTDVRRIIDAFPRYREFAAELGAWDQPIPGGYLTGFVDLLFRHEGRYYIVDWKSNRRGGRQADFRTAGVHDEMAEHGYWLQMLIYAVAVHQYLKGSLPNYTYDEHFGGIYYLFLRGIDGSGDGIYADRPPEALIEALSTVLGDFA